MREIQRTDAAEPRPFHVPLIDTLGPVRRGAATVMSSSSTNATLSTPAGDPPINRPRYHADSVQIVRKEFTWDGRVAIFPLFTCVVLYLPWRERINVMLQILTRIYVKVSLFCV